jgi:hypothetical protein
MGVVSDEIIRGIDNKHKSKNSKLVNFSNCCKIKTTITQNNIAMMYNAQPIKSHDKKK